MIACKCMKYKMYIVRDRETMQELYRCCQDCIKNIGTNYTVELVEECKNDL